MTSGGAQSEAAAPLPAGAAGTSGEGAAGRGDAARHHLPPRLAAVPRSPPLMAEQRTAAGSSLRPLRPPPPPLRPRAAAAAGPLPAGV